MPGFYTAALLNVVTLETASSMLSKCCWKLALWQQNGLLAFPTSSSVCTTMNCLGGALLLAVLKLISAIDWFLTIMNQLTRLAAVLSQPQRLTVQVAA